ncbi:hypothetical protein FOCC_FOCC006251, partial [Frankliniella occidentalis]
MILGPRAEVAEARVLVAPLWLQAVGLHAQLDESVALLQHAHFGVPPRHVVPRRPQALRHGGRARPQAPVHRVRVGLLRPERGLGAEDVLQQARVRDTHAAQQASGVVVVHLLPADVRRAPVVALAHPRAEAAVEVQGLVVGEDEAVALFRELLDQEVVALGPDLDNVLFGVEVSVNLEGERGIKYGVHGKQQGSACVNQQSTDLAGRGEAARPQDDWELFALVGLHELLERAGLEDVPQLAEVVAGAGRRVVLPHPADDGLRRVPAVEVD